MKLLLDECVPRVFCAEFPEHDCRTVAQMKWDGVANGALLLRAGESFDVLLTVDRNHRHLKNPPVAVIVVHVKNNDYDTLRAFVPRIRMELQRIRPRELVVIE